MVLLQFIFKCFFSLNKRRVYTLCRCVSLKVKNNQNIMILIQTSLTKMIFAASFGDFCVYVINNILYIIKLEGCSFSFLFLVFGDTKKSSWVNCGDVIRYSIMTTGSRAEEKQVVLQWLLMWSCCHTLTASCQNKGQIIEFDSLLHKCSQRQWLHSKRWWCQCSDRKAEFLRKSEFA